MYAEESFHLEWMSFKIPIPSLIFSDLVVLTHFVCLPRFSAILIVINGGARVGGRTGQQYGFAGSIPASGIEFIDKFRKFRVDQYL